MESNKLRKKIQDWATSLGFRLPDGSSPSAEFFTLLTATPHRRRLWETIIESVQPRQKVERMRKQILVAKLQGRVKVSRSNSQQITDRIDLWHKQNALEAEIKDKRSVVLKLEGNIVAKASDLIFEICQLAELEKQFEELNDKLLVLKLFSNREKKLIKQLDSKLIEVNEISNTDVRLQNFEENLGVIINQLLSTDVCKCLSVNAHSCSLLNTVNDLCESRISEQHLWEEIIKYKINFLQQFSEFLIQFNLNEKNILSEKAAEMDKNVNQLVTQLKQKIISKSLQVIQNSTKEKLLETEMQELEDRFIHKESNDGNLNEANSFLSPYKMSDSYQENEKILKSYLSVMGLKTYRKFLKEELNRLENEKRITEQRDFPKEEQQLVDDFKSILDEINSYSSEQNEIGNAVLSHHSKLEFLQLSQKEETKRMKETKIVEQTTEKLKSASEKQITIFLEIPLDAFKTFESSSGRVQLECESKSHCLENYGGELKHFFSAMLIPPLANLQKIISEMTNRKRILNEMKKFISDRESLASFERKIHNRVSSISYDIQFCEKAFKESDGILWNTFSKAEQLFKEIDFLEKILKNWVEQPYRLMITEKLDGKTLKEFEEQYRKGNVSRF